MKGIVFDNIWEARIWNKEESCKRGLCSNITTYKWSIKSLKSTSKVTKSKYAEYNNISETIVIDEEGSTTPNPEYTALKSSYTVQKHAVIVNDDLITYDEEGKPTEPSEVIDVSSQLYKVTGE